MSFRNDYLRLLLGVTLTIILVYFQDDLESALRDWDVKPSLISVLVPALVSISLVVAFSSILHIIFRRRQRDGKSQSIALGLRNLSQFAIAFFIITIILSALGISLKDALTSLSLIAVAFVLITKDYISNFINGMILAFSPVIGVGDYVKIGDKKGKIVDMNLSTIELITDDDDIIFVSNNSAYNSDIINYTHRDVKKSSIEFELNPSNYPDINALQEEITGFLGNFSDQIEPDSYNLRIVKAELDKLTMKFQYILKDPRNKTLELEIRRYVMRKLIYRLYS